MYKLNKKLYISCNVLIKPLRSLWRHLKSLIHRFLSLHWSHVDMVVFIWFLMVFSPSAKMVMVECVELVTNTNI